jgi:cytosine/adenosine deaminase-related metal-dependent hydrolase
MTDIYTHCSVLVGPELAWVPEATLVVEAGRIVAIERQRRSEGIDLGGHLVMPAFVNAHTHIGDTAAKELGVGLTVEEAVYPPDGLKHRLLRAWTAEQLDASIRQGLREMLRHGVAAFGDFREGGLDGVRALRRLSQGLPIVPVILGRPVFVPGMDADARRREIAAVAEEADGFGIPSMDAFDLATLQHIRRAHPGRLLAVHVAESPRDTARSIAQHGLTEVVRALAFEPDVMVHLTHATPDDIARLKARGQRIVCCPRTNLLLADGVPPLAAFHAQGMAVSLGTDNMMFSSPDMFREMDMASRLARGASLDPRAADARAVLSAATLGGAQALGLDARLGTIEPGKDATFLVLDATGDALVGSADPVSCIVHRCGPQDIVRSVFRGTTVIADGRRVAGA